MQAHTAQGSVQSLRGRKPLPPGALDEWSVLALRGRRVKRRERLGEIARTSAARKQSLLGLAPQRLRDLAQQNKRCSVGKHVIHEV